MKSGRGVLTAPFGMASYRAATAGGGAGGGGMVDCDVSGEGKGRSACCRLAERSTSSGTLS